VDTNLKYAPTGVPKNEEMIRGIEPYPGLFLCGNINELL
jgi:hypothetical protein